MKCTAPGRNIKVFGRAILCLAKIGEDIYFEGEASGLAVRTVNQSRSAYGSFSFHTSYFSKFSLQSQNSLELRCKVSSRSCLSIFKNLASLEKSVENFSIELKFREGEFVFTILHKTGIKKQFNLTFQECEGLSAIFNKNSSVIHVVSNQRFLSDCVVHFPMTVGEITLSVKHDHATLSNYVEEQEQYSKALQTEMRLAGSEFPSYDVSVDREVTFCLKEWRAVLGLQDALGQQLHLYFDDPGRPIIMCIEGDGLYECDFVLATLTDQNSTQCSQNSAVSKVASVTKDQGHRNTSNATKPTANTTSRSAHKTQFPPRAAASHNGTSKIASRTQRQNLDESVDEPNPFSKQTTGPNHATNHVTRATNHETSMPGSLILSPDKMCSLSPLPPSPESDEYVPPCIFTPTDPDKSAPSRSDNTAPNRSDNMTPNRSDNMTPSGRDSMAHDTTPPCKRFKRLSSDEDDDESVINPTNNILYCDDSD